MPANSTGAARLDAGSLRPTVSALSLRIACWTVAAVAVLAPSSLLAADKPSAKSPDQSAAKGQEQRAGKPAVDPAWLERMPKEDRAALDCVVGFAPPEFTEELEWIGGPATTWKDLRGKVVVIQSWSVRTAGGRSAPGRLEEALSGFKSDDVVGLALHTPDGADSVSNYLKQKPVAATVVVDPSGAFCDALGIYKRPVNVVVDRNGQVRYAGLQPEALPKAVQQLVAEEADAKATPPARVVEASPGGFPTFSNPVRSALDLRGQKAPPFYVQQWITEPVDPSGRLVLLDFFATWCGPCIAAVPHLNQIARSHGGDICVVGVSDESSSEFERGLIKRRLKMNDFSYALALDPGGRMKQAYRITGIPHVVIVSSDGVVRWQGHPSHLNESALTALINANRSLRAGGADVPPNRWQADRSRSNRDRRRSGGGKTGY